jgi:protein-tyrosine phosphatase
MIDLHCHILPGLDDGAKTIDHALEMGRSAWEDGIDRIVATPHVFRENVSQADFPAIRKNREELGRAFRKSALPVELLAGAEVHISHNLIDEVRINRQDLVINQGSYMFVEFPQEHVFYGVKDLFFDLMSEGIHPIIAHPERNTVFMKNPTLLYDLVRMGASVQSNSGSFLGRYGQEPEKSAFAFLEYGLIHFIASDGHGVRSIPPRLSGAVRTVGAVIGEESARALVKDNPEAVLEDRSLAYLPDPVNPGDKKKTFLLRKPKLFK